MNLNKKRLQQESISSDQKHKVKRSKTAESSTEGMLAPVGLENHVNGSNNDEAAMEGAAPTSAGHHETDCVEYGEDISKFLTLPALAPSVVKATPHKVSSCESMSSLEVESTASGREDSSTDDSSSSLVRHFDQTITMVHLLKYQQDLTGTDITLIDQQYKKYDKKLVRLWVVIGTFALCGVLVVLLSFLPRHNVVRNTVCVPGAGFSGFWFTLGRLKSIHEPASKDYYCYSAGCLGVVAMLRNFTVDEVSEMAFGVQSMWKNGEISRFQVVSKFLEDLLYGFPDDSLAPNNPQALAGSIDILSRLHIITSVQGKWFGLNHVIRTPQSFSELREMLLQTTWIPVAIGIDLTYKGHMDGAFTALHHPSCDQSLGLPLIPDLYFNALNVNLSRQKLEKLWNAGLEYDK